MNKNKKRKAINVMPQKKLFENKFPHVFIAIGHMMFVQDFFFKDLTFNRF
jgi:hypothetical protein